MRPLELVVRERDLSARSHQAVVPEHPAKALDERREAAIRHAGRDEPPGRGRRVDLELRIRAQELAPDRTRQPLPVDVA